MNTQRTISGRFLASAPSVSFYIDIPFEVDMIKLVDGRGINSDINSRPTLPTVSFIPNQVIAMIGNTFGSGSPTEFYFKQPTAIVGNHSLRFTIGGSNTFPNTTFCLVFEFWKFTVGLPMTIKSTNWQNECITVSDINNSFILDIQFPVDEIIIENRHFVGFPSAVNSTLHFYSDFLQQLPEINTTGTNIARSSGNTLGMSGANYDIGNKYHFRFEQPKTIRGNYRIWNRPDPTVFVDAVDGRDWSLWTNVVASFYVRFVSYR